MVQTYSPTEIYNSDSHKGDITSLLKVLPLPDGYDITPPNRVQVKLHGRIVEDHRRFVTIESAWFDNKPVMVFMRAGREGRDKEEVIVTDTKGYKEMVSYLASLINWGDIEKNDEPLKTFFGYGIKELLEGLNG